MTRKGIDISYWQGNVDFHALKDNLDFVIIRSTYGNGYKDTSFEKNRDGARAVGLGVGFYHYAYPQYNQPEAEADWFTKIVSCQPGEILCLDFEETFATPVDWCKRFLDKVTSNMGFKPLLYINFALVKSYDWKPVIDAGYGLWLAYWDYNPDSTNWDTPWPVVAFRQYSNKGIVAGLTPLDLDIFYGDMSQFYAYGNPAPSVPTPPVPVPPSVPSEPTPTIPEPIPVPPTNPSTPPNTVKPNWFTKLINWVRSSLGL